MRVQTQFSIFLVNKPGVLAGVTGALAKAKVNMTALTLMDSLEHGVLRIICDDPQATSKVLSQTNDRWTETEVLVIELENEPGAFAKLASRLAAEHINIAYAYCTGGAKGGRTTAVFKVADMKKAQKILADKDKPKPAPRNRTVKTRPVRRPR